MLQAPSSRAAGLGRYAPNRQDQRPPPDRGNVAFINAKTALDFRFRIKRHYLAVVARRRLDQVEFVTFKTQTFNRQSERLFITLRTVLSNFWRILKKERVVSLVLQQFTPNRT